MDHLQGIFYVYIMAVVASFFAFIFDIKLSNGKTLHLTNYGSNINIDGIKYLPNSALNIVKADVNDSAHDLLEVHGIFNECGIRECDELTAAQVIISMFFVEPKFKEAFLTFSCTPRVLREDDDRISTILVSQIQNCILYVG